MMSYRAGASLPMHGPHARPLKRRAPRMAPVTGWSTRRVVASTTNGTSVTPLVARAILPMCGSPLFRVMRVIDLASGYGVTSLLS
jgi:hypothetical protein